MATIRVTQRRSSSGSNKRQLDTLRSLGLRRIGHTVEVKDCEQARGMVHAVRHLVEADPEVRTPKAAPGRAHPEGHTLKGTSKQGSKQEQSS
jgi:large subunit ribosomal protein L30